MSVMTKRVLFATGFEPFDLTEKPTLGYGRLRNVISLEALEKHLKTHTVIDSLLPRHSTEKGAVSIAFIQCVGSRDATQDANYCSRVCCRVSLKLANLIQHHQPEIEITIFYMDLQTLDSSSHQIRNQMEGVTFIRSIPAEVTRNEDGMLMLRFEDNTSGVMTEKRFNLVILAGAIRPVDPLDDMSGLEEIEPDQIGFWKLSDLAGKDTRKHLSIAGAASGPMDILSAMTHGRYSVRQLASETEDPGHELS